MAKGQIKQKQSKINQKQFENMCAIQCTKEEICAILEISEDTLERWCKNTYDKNFAVVFAEKRQFGKMSLRRTQWRMAETDKTMAIWLGKQYLGQRDNVEVAHTDMSKVDELLKEIKDMTTNYVDNNTTTENTEHLEN